VTDIIPVQFSRCRLRGFGACLTADSIEKQRIRDGVPIRRRLNSKMGVTQGEARVDSGNPPLQLESNTRSTILLSHRAWAMIYET